MKIHLHGVLWPNHWLFDKEADDFTENIPDFSRMANPDLLLKNKFMLSTDVLYHISILCTFGICSPFLAFIITVCLVMKLLTWIMVFGRFLSFRLKDRCSSEDADLLDTGVQLREMSVSSSSSIKSQKLVVDNAVAALSECCVNILGVFDVTIWPIIWSSCLFFAVLTFDIAADEVVSEQQVQASHNIQLLFACVFDVKEYYRCDALNVCVCAQM